MSASDHLAIVVPTYNRETSLKRLLHSLSQVDAAGYAKVTLVLSIDGAEPNGNAAVLQEAERFKWHLGEKRVLRRTERLGLRRHILMCGDLAEDFGTVVVLEDDLFVSSFCLHWVRAALDAYAGDVRVAGLSLYTYDYNEFAGLPFSPIADGFDNYFCQVPSSWGQVWTRDQWRGFRSFYATNPTIPDTALLPARVKGWPASSWKKHFMHYLAATERWVVFPRTALSTNFGDTGTHYSHVSSRHQVPLLLGKPNYRLSRLEQSLAHYDGYFEPLPATLKKLNPKLEGYNFDTDFYATKERNASNRPYRLSICGNASPVLTFGLRMLPFEANVIYNISGDTLVLGPTASAREPTLAQRSRLARTALKCDISSLEAEIATKVRSTRTYRLGKALLHPLDVIR